MFGEGRLGPGGPATRHGARLPLPGVGDVPATGPAGCPGSQTGVGASSKTGHGRRRGLLPRRQRGGRGREELPWPPSLWPQRPGTVGLTRHRCMGHSQCRTGPWGRAPGRILGRASQPCWDAHHLRCAGTSAAQRQDGNPIKRPGLPSRFWHREAFWMSLGPTQPFACMAEAQQPRQEGSGCALLPKHCPCPFPPACPSR